MPNFVGSRQQACILTRDFSNDKYTSDSRSPFHKDVNRSSDGVGSSGPEIPVFPLKKDEFQLIKARDLPFAVPNTIARKMAGKARTKTTKSYDDQEDFNNFEADGIDESDYSSDWESEEQVGEDDSDEAGMDDSGRLRLRADISLEGEDYAGKKSTRKATIEEDDDDDDEEEDEDLELSERRQATYRGESSDEEEEENLLGGENDELDALGREYEKLREEEEKGLEILKSQERDSQQKGQAVRNQKALWDRSLEVRIALQKLLGSADRLPRKRAKVCLSQENEEVKEAYTKLTDAAVKTLDCLLDLGSLLIDNNTAITQIYSTSPNANGKREAFREAEGESVSDEAWEKLDGLYAKLVPYRDNSLDRWQRKTQIFTGAVGKAKLRAFNQSLSQQVASSMRDSSRLIARMRLKRGSVRVLGEQLEDDEADKNPTVDTVDDVELLHREATAVGEAGDPETFDDSEFYQQLLREFLEQSDLSTLGSMALYSTGRQHAKKRKQVDRRASKGRKLRYNVFEPLCNFMAPKPMVLPPIAAQLFSNLFGQKSKNRKSTS